MIYPQLHLIGFVHCSRGPRGSFATSIALSYELSSQATEKPVSKATQLENLSNSSVIVERPQTIHWH
ncbi:unnamed protein product [Calypogeia fissa]